LSIFREAGFASFVSAFNQVDELKDKEVDVLGPALVGIAKGIDAGGLMLLQTDAGMQRLNSGEVSVRVK
jgi:BirA family biotin operon repressor/biotin-[acetyl-CoA-carboxylase] ligase